LACHGRMHASAYMKRSEVIKVNGGVMCVKLCVTIKLSKA
jgi:hypothetical protein